MLSSPRRTLVKALFVSLLIHLVLVMRVDEWVPVQAGSSPGVIKGVLKPAVPADSAAALTNGDGRPEGVHQPALSSPIQREASPVKAAAPSLQKKALPRVVVSQPLGSSVQPQTAVGDPLSASDVAEYRMALAVAAKRFRTYPVLAKERAWEGVVKIELLGSALSPVAEARLVQSSGQSVLDEHALSLTEKALQVTGLPEGLRGRNFRILFPVKYSLEALQ